MKIYIANLFEDKITDRHLRDLTEVRCAQQMDSMLTAVVPIHQMEGKLQNLRSWLANCREIHVVLVNDLSDDSTQLELEEIIANCESFEGDLVKGHFGSPGASRNTGLALAKSEFVTFWDSDDLPNPEHFVEMSKMLATSDAQVCIGEYEIVNMKNQKAVLTQISARDINREVAITPGVWRMVFRTDSIPKNPFTDLHLAEDHIFLQEISFPTMRKEIYKENVYTYFYAGQGNLTSDRALIPQLLPALLQTNHFRINAKSEAEIEFSSILLLREFMTMIKNGSLFLKLKVLFLLAKIFTRENRKTRRDLLIAFKTIMRNK